MGFTHGNEKIKNKERNNEIGSYTFCPNHMRSGFNPLALGGILMATGEYVRRLSVDITEEQAKFLNQLPHGSKKMIFQTFINDLIRLSNNEGIGKVAGAYMERYITIEKISKLRLEGKGGE